MVRGVVCEPINIGCAEDIFRANGESYVNI